ncbi:MAG: endonuclease MutS2 [Selenomonadaceae bacterium]|nr:endonuclease MutS2 [Selenomonadaceae bacterium]
MNRESYRILEFDSIRLKLKSLANSDWAREIASQIQPSDDLDEVQSRLDETAEAVRINSAGTIPLNGIYDLRPMLKKLQLGSNLDVEDLMEVLSTMLAMKSVKRFFKSLEMDLPILKNLSSGIEILGNLERDLDNTIDEHGAIRDSASPELNRIRRELRNSQSKIKDRISDILHDSNLQKFFQDSIVTVRDDRYVIPIKQEYRNQFPGIVHDQSSTGATVFIEPMRVVELNNEIKNLSIEELREIDRILRKLSNEIRKNSETLLENCERLAQIDFANSKAKLARDLRANQPLLNDSGKTNLIQARHPLIPDSSVVPIDLELGNRFRTLLITGPNTGGKTVSMKTLGILALMNQSGLFIPAAIGSEISIYREIFADIGDEQSIEQSLSTFSSHMTSIVKILDQAEDRDLILLDEIGAGTDPEEGSSLAMAILEKFLQIGSSVLASTHYSELKTFAYSREGIENACVEFDEKTLKPTYRILIGIPGASNAFAISKRLGLSESIILRAKQFITEDHAQFENIVSALERERMEFEKRNADIAERQKRITESEKKISELRDEISKSKTESIRKAREKSQSMIRQAKREAEEIIASLREQFDDQGTKKRSQAIQNARDRLRHAEEENSIGIMSDGNYRRRINIKKLSIGDTVYIPRLDQKGTVLEIHGKDLTLQIGILRMELDSSQCRFVGDSEKIQEDRVEKSRTSFVSKVQNISREIDVRGMLVNEAESVVGKFLDDAQLAGLKEILIIHGKGTGALRTGLHDFLKNNGSVAKFSVASLDEGGAGATIVTLR